MKRRNFVKTAGAMGIIPFSSMTAGSSNVPDSNDKREYLELIKYHLHLGDKKKLIRNFYNDVAIPALNRCGLDRIGVFTVTYGPNDPSLYVLIPHPSLASVLETPAKLVKDKEYLSAGSDFLNKPQSDAAYVRMEKSLMVAFRDMPKVEKPINLMDKSRIYELRIYESHSRLYAKRKVSMFNEGGEINIFRETGLQPVFFGETIIGPMMPNLTYMVVFENMDERDKGWNTFRKSPAWEKLKADPQYKDTVSNITDIILSPASCSQI
jgi:hypothetical protein